MHTPTERFWAKVVRTSHCWEWTAGLDQRGYGRFQTGTSRATARTVLAHRWAYEEAHGPIPDGLLVCHRCDNPACVRPDHMFLGTELDNQSDSWNKGRRERGEQRAHAKLTEAAVRDIRARYAMGDVTQQALADEFDISRSLVSGVVSRHRWTHI
jgi:HNH endonuclease